MRWTTWGHRVSRGYGVFTYNDCNPFCVSGHFHDEAVRVHFFYPVHCPGKANRFYKRGTLFRANGSTERIAMGCP